MRLHRYIPMIPTLPAMPTSAVHEPGQRSSAGASSDWNRPETRKKAPYAHQKSQCELTNAKWIQPATSESRPASSTAVDHRTPRVRWPATTRSGVAAMSDTAQDRPRRLDRFLRLGDFFAPGFACALCFGLAWVLCFGFACVVCLALCLTFTLRLALCLTFPWRLALGLTCLRGRRPWGAGGGAAGTEIEVREPPGVEPEPWPPPLPPPFPGTS